MPKPRRKRPTSAAAREEEPAEKSSKSHPSSFKYHSFLVVFFLIGTVITMMNTQGTIMKDLLVKNTYYMDLKRQTRTLNLRAAPQGGHHHQQHHQQETTKKKKPRIAIVTSYVNMGGDKGPSLPSNRYLPHLQNKACYALRHNYTLIFNTTRYWGLKNNDDDSSSGGIQQVRRHHRHLDSATWHCVPHLQAALNTPNKLDDDAEDNEDTTTTTAPPSSGYLYDWVFWTDADYIFQNLSRPIEEFLEQWEDEPHNNVHVFVPNDMAPHYYFSSWAVLIRNSPFGHRLLYHWNEFANGICPNGNFPYRLLDWKMGDQPGLWYALIKTHAEFYGNNISFPCNPNDGYLQVQDPNVPLGLEFDQYFGRIFNRTSPPTMNSNLTTTTTTGQKPQQQQQQQQPIVWSEVDGGLGVNFESKVGYRRGLFGIKYDPNNLPSFPGAFGLHIKEDLPDHVLRDISSCRLEYNDAISVLNITAPRTLQFN